MNIFIDDRGYTYYLVNGKLIPVTAKIRKEG